MFRGKSIVVLDISHQVRNTLTTVLQNHDYIATGFDDLGETLEFCENNKPDLLIVNFYKTGFDTGDFSSQLASIQVGYDLPVVCITGSRKEDSQLLSYLPNIVHILHKPVKIKDLVLRINDYFDTESIQAVPIFNGDLASVDIWKLLKNIEETGVSGYIEIITRDSKTIKFTLKKGMLDDLSLMGGDENDPINYLLNEKEGIITVYQQLVNLAPVEEVFDPAEKDAVLFEEGSHTVGQYILNDLERLVTFFFDNVGRQDTLKSFITVSMKISIKTPEIKDLNVNYKGQVTWESDDKIKNIENYLEIFAQLFKSLIVEMNKQSGQNYELMQILTEENTKLKQAGFYGIFENL